MFRKLRMITLVCAILLVTSNVLVMAQDEPVTLTWWVENTAQDELDHLQATLVEPFEEAHPNINLEITGQESMQDVLRTAILGGAAPDVLLTFGPSWNAEYIAGGFMEPLDSYAEQYGWEDELQPWAYATGTVDGTLYSVPLNYESIVMFYNQALFEEHGWEVPTNRAELEAVASAAVEAGIHPFSYGNRDAIWANGHLISAYLNNYVEQADLRAALTGEKQWTDQVFVDAFTLFNDDIAEKQWWAGGLENYYQFEGADYWTELVNGEAAMIIVGTWGFNNVLEYFVDSPDAWNWAPIPNMNESPRPSVYPLAIGSTLAINAASEHKDEAAVVLDYLISNPEVVLSISSGFNFSEWLVPLHFTREDFPEGIDPRVQDFHSQFAQATSEGNYGYANWTFWPGPANTHLRVEIESVWEELTPLEEYLAAHQAVWDELFASGNTIPVP
ncbi:MAG: hypothetical protein CL610_24855 [Anaerolineaceae bacterium]|nr:hypothetical protein [Anaerolineaceae bacterium]